MARLHPYPKDSLQSLLQLTTEEVHSTLIASPQGDSIFFQNFSTLALKAVKYLAASLNHLSPNQSLGGVIDRLAQGLSTAMQEYRSRNVFVHSVHSPSSASSREDLQKEDEIYHFLNTRNNLLPVECLSTYENDRQRKELQEFVEEMKKHEGGAGAGGKREHKGSLRLPKDHNFQLKIGRKRTFDPQPLPSHHFQPLPQKRQEEQVSNNPISQGPPLALAPTYQHVETQTQSHFMATSQIIYEQKQDENRKQQAEVPSQPQFLSGGISQAIMSALSHNQLAAPGKKQREKKKGLLDSDNKKKKTKFASSNQNIAKGEPTLINTSKSLTKKKLLLPAPASQCSLKLVKLNEKMLTICTKEVGITWGMPQDEITIHINYTPSQHQLPPASVLSSPIILDTATTNPTIQAHASNETHPCTEKVQSQQDKAIADAISALVNQNQSSSSLHGEWEGRKKYLLSKSKQPPKQSQRIPISTIKINPATEAGPDPAQALHNFTRLRQTESFLITDGTNKVNIKRKKYTGERQLFTSFIISQGENQHNLSQHLRTSKLNILPFDTDPLLTMMKKDSGCSSTDKNQFPTTNKFPSFSKNNQPQSLTSSPSHDYLISRERSDPKQLLNRLMELEKDEKQQGGLSLQREAPTFNRTGSNCSEDHGDTPGGRTRGRESQMIRISNAHRMNEEMGSQLTQGHSRFFQNNKISSDMQKDPSKDREREKERERQGFMPLPPHSHPSFLKKTHLSLIPENDPIDTREAPNPIKNKSSLNNIEKPSIDPHQCLSPSVPHKSILLRQSTQILPVRLPMGKLRPQGRSWNSISDHSKPGGLQKSESSDLHGGKMGSLDAELLRRKLRARGNKDKLEHYLQLIQATHLKFCGRDCEHQKQLYSGKEGSIAEQLLRLAKRLN